MYGISVVLITYNASTRNFLEASIHSVLEQNHDNYELIIINDGSTDDTEQICKKYENHGKVRYYKKDNGGPSSARNFGIKQAAFEYIAFLDDDDLYKKDMLQTISRFLTKQIDKKAMIYCQTEEIDLTGTILRTSLIKKNTSSIYEELLYGNFITTSATIVHKEIFHEIGLFDENLRYSEDYDLWLRIAKKYPIYGINKVLVTRRIHTNSLSNDFEKMHTSHYHVLSKNLELSTTLSPSNKDEILKNFYLNHASIYLGNKKYKNYRKVYKKAKIFGSLSFLWKVKYLLSFFPFFYDFSYQLYKRLKQRSLKKI